MTDRHEVSAFERQFLCPEGVAAAVVVRVLSRIIKEFPDEPEYHYANRCLERWQRGYRGIMSIFAYHPSDSDDGGSVTASAALTVHAFRCSSNEDDWETFWRMAQKTFSLARKPFPGVKALIDVVRSRMKEEGCFDPRYEDPWNRGRIDRIAKSIDSNGPNHSNPESSEAILHAPVWQQAIKSEVGIVGNVIRAIGDQESKGRAPNERSARAVLVSGLLQLAAMRMQQELAGEPLQRAPSRAATPTRAR
jgi:hypothetical protein